ncbi:cell division protein SepF [Modestobacter versicolor]|uniref:Cell division protein SepF n=1 Tax=Modestobacter versicolor TaxID=429133 RepID=A0A839XX66_9ACTN|nr:cell division protein SepF [Modestobacter versicolor]MBB3675608.1 cell division inhibitor SepF [Modestobacter versicolor]
MAGAMRRMGVYLGLVEDDDARGGYDRYAARQSDYDHDDRGYDRGYDRYAADGHDEPLTDDRYGYGTGYGAGGYDTDYPVEAAADDRVEERAPEPEVSLGRRPATPRTLGLAPTSGGSTAARLGGSGLGAAGGSGIGASAGRSRISGGLAGGVSGSAGLAMSEPVAVDPTPAPEPAPAPEPKSKSYRITTVHPASYNEARTIGERFRDGMPVIMNLTEMEHADAKRLVDFAIGLTFGLHGSIERVTAKVFLLSPQDVDVTAEDKARIREGGFFSQS